MDKATLLEKLKSAELAEVYFTKVDGTDREMWCTLNPEYIYEDSHVESSNRKTNDSVISVWDVKANGWRSFRIDSVYEMYIDGEKII